MSALLFFGAGPQAQSERWTPVHETPVDWLGLLGSVGAWVLLAVFLYFLVRGVLFRARYRAVRALGEAERQELTATIHAAEKKTTGEIVVVVLERSDRHPGANWLAAIFSLFVGTILLVAYLPWERPALLIAIQFALGAFGYACAVWLPDFRSHFISRCRGTEVSEEQALQEFYSQSVYATEEATGILILVSLAERRVVVLGDKGIDAQVSPELWRDVDIAILKGVQGGKLHEGLSQGIERCGQVLAEHFPWREGDRNELPDHVLVRRE